MFKIAFLFLTMTNVFHEQYWQDFFRGNEDRYSILVHSKYGVQHNKWFRQFQMPYTIENSWARTMKAQIGMLKEALKDPQNEIFIFCSQNCIPLQSFDFMYDTVMSLRKSIFWYQVNPHADKNRSCYNIHRDIQPIPADKQYKNSQWIILTRKHAQMMVDDNNIINLISRYPHDQEHYPSTFFAQNELLHEIYPCEKTLVIWNLNPNPPYVFSNLKNPQEFALLQDAITYGLFFVRKIDEFCDLSPLDPLLTYRAR